MATSRSTTPRRTCLVTAASACVCFAVTAVASAAGAANAGGVPRHTAPETATTRTPASTLRCYATRNAPESVVCYRFSAKTEFRHGELVYVPILVQVPTPAAPPPVTVVDSLSDIRPHG
ncbi:hypothetical protein [Streptomyces sp. NPDC005573]|uniref:hypothetical protein n=1 Tax=Streptomyces sp. NPDC005573 TaxID=3156890 RepID=UPI0033ADFC52